MAYYCDDTKETARNYKEYLKTQHWKNLRESLVNATGGICQCCKMPDRQLVLHHKHYNTVGREEHKDISVLCHSCHLKQHQDTDPREIDDSLIHASLGHTYKDNLFPLCAWFFKEKSHLYLNARFTRNHRHITCPICKARFRAHVQKCEIEGKDRLLLQNKSPSSSAHKRNFRNYHKKKAVAFNVEKSKRFEEKRYFFTHIKNKP